LANQNGDHIGLRIEGGLVLECGCESPTELQR
jgi:hypothetical protein